MVTRQEIINIIAADPSDNLYLEIGIAGHADYIVSGDQHLLRLKEYCGISIITPTEFQAIIPRPSDQQIYCRQKPCVNRSLAHR
jgi:predicted nucleic acid-binding protein